METINRTCVDRPERWQRALQRALDANLAYIELIAGDGAWAVSSQRDCERGYIATTQTCTCEAGCSGDPVCCHRALIRALFGVLPLPEDGPTCDIRPGDYLDVRTCTMVTVAGKGATVSATWHDSHTGRWGLDSAPLIAEMISSGILSPVAIVQVSEPTVLPQLQLVPAGESWWLEPEIA